MDRYEKFAAPAGKFILIGFGSVGQGFLPLLLRHFDLPRERILIITGDDTGRAQAEKEQISFKVCPLTPGNYREILNSIVERGDFLLNLSVNVSSLALIEYCHEREILYLDACIEPWPGGYTNIHISPSERSNYGFREQALALRQKLGGGTTAVLCHGANPGLISHWVKRALLNIAHDIEGITTVPRTQDEWGQLAQKLDIKIMQCAERDTQIARPFKHINEFVNTWSIDGFIGEGQQPAELGWGSHEKYEPADARHHRFGCDAAIYLQRPGMRTQVLGWTPLTGTYQGFLITHSESISIANYFTLKNGNDARYRPTVYYAYHPTDATMLSINEFSGSNFRLQNNVRLLMHDIEQGTDALGVALMGHARGIYWYGSMLSIEQARDLAPYNNATSLQVAAGILGGTVWAIENPASGIVEPDEMSFERVLQVATPYLGEVTGRYSDWTPLQGRQALFEEDLDTSDPWQFKNFRIS
ncbi:MULTISPECIES: saccharopine dehydrogenase NADP-binding domain-containing protein [Nitrosomonas]|uniref:homospermidine synthase n=1 Tax=Nitrosomonas TaxID=914 RepID=UPI001934C501|nr:MULTISPECIES: saccharopine dehydrogenase NADP-binding domain-containing protein [Nitrosomonas]QOJ08510.1 MAG: homospermidine synthase [Nitrosomonas sp. H1_AOB3]HRN81009.1 saccharopine dehydrogenase NADP-binding domain-containing protein [Nitrosomonas europaea]HRO55770.1 saccharopine dehydrogenase NADP-binding domain-containing protein [Nitrosomonas europaea]HRQ07821.1 saccharopine dehydrogenase NADP-binding domain-containing protein [Nitrosomonas europaea]HUM73498.1 saccharopine dehydrogena